jgi:hypothetical protein
MPTGTPVPPGYLLEDCKTSTEDICVYSIAPQPASVIIALKYKKEIDPSRLPYLSVGDQEFQCEIIYGYPGRLYCSGPSISGNFLLVLRYSENQKICSGTFQINEYSASAPPKNKKPGGTYP